MSPEKLQAFAKQGGRALLQTLPKVALGAIKGAFGGALLLTAIGGALAFASSLIWPADVPRWVVVATAVLCPLVLGLAGLYTGAVRGLLKALAAQLVEKKLLAYVYAQVKPAAVSAAKRVTAGASAQAVAAQVKVELEKQLDAADAGEPPGSFADRVARFLTLRSRKLLALSLISHVARAKSGAEAVQEVETLGLQKLEKIVVETLEDLFSMKLTLVSAAALVVCAAPQAIWWLTR